MQQRILKTQKCTNRKYFSGKNKFHCQKAGLKLNIQKTKIMASILSLHGKQMEKKWEVSDFIFLGSKINVGSDCNHRIKRCLLLGRKAMTNLDSVLRSRDIILLTKVHIVKACLPKSKHLLISWWQSLSAVILEPKEIVWCCFHFFPLYLP